MAKPIKPEFKVTVTREGSSKPFTVTVVGRVGWAILSLIRAGKRGCTTITRPAPRWSDYVFKARALGINVETIHEGHEGSFAGFHARYVLHDELQVFGGNLAEYLASPEGRREFGSAEFGISEPVRDRIGGER